MTNRDRVLEKKVRQQVEALHRTCVKSDIPYWCIFLEGGDRLVASTNMSNEELAQALLLVSLDRLNAGEVAQP